MARKVEGGAGADGGDEQHQQDGDAHAEVHRHHVEADHQRGKYKSEGEVLEAKKEAKRVRS